MRKEEEEAKREKEVSRKRFSSCRYKPILSWWCMAAIDTLVDCYRKKRLYLGNMNSTIPLLSRVCPCTRTSPTTDSPGVCFAQERCPHPYMPRWGEKYKRGRDRPTQTMASLQQSCKRVVTVITLPWARRTCSSSRDHESGLPPPPLRSILCSLRNQLAVAWCWRDGPFPEPSRRERLGGGGCWSG